MKPIKQTKLHSKTTTGNCMASSFASILEMELSDIPKFEEMFDSKGWFQEVKKWFFSLGFQLMEYNKDPKLEGYYLVSGDSPRSNVLHMVVFKSGKMVHGPHPSNDGILSFYDAWVLIPLDPSGYIKKIDK